MCAFTIVTMCVRLRYPSTVAGNELMNITSNLLNVRTSNKTMAEEIVFFHFSNNQSLPIENVHFQRFPYLVAVAQSIRNDPESNGIHLQYTSSDTFGALLNWMDE